MVLLTVNVVVHLTTAETHPNADDLWRWAVHVGHDWSDRASCLQAGLEPDRVDALMRGQAVAVAVVKALRFADVAASGTTYELDHDPCGEPWPLVETGDF